mmetsp:Transcript_19453/g.45601  ORF Transcript_19453/g.45601 Transcript_19453/m.45601 type:complete len:81 (-) Transcript_19453:1154-1396(-)
MVYRSNNHLFLSSSRYVTSRKATCTTANIATFNQSDSQAPTIPNDAITSDPGKGHDVAFEVASHSMILPWYSFIIRALKP